jgi:acetyl esterase/lipase
MRFANSGLVALVVATSSLVATVTCRAEDDVIKEKPITYCEIAGETLQLDMARPAGEGPFPAIVMIHGGGWEGGSRAGYLGALPAMAKHGYVALTISYRLTKPDASGKAKYPFPAAVNDCKCAIRWLRANAAKYKVDPERIGVTGGSAGGHLSLMLGVTSASDGLEGDGGYADQSSKVQAVVNIFGPTDMPHISKSTGGAAPIVERFLGGKLDAIPDVYKKASPISYVKKDLPPMLTIHGTADTLVPPDQAERFDKAMREAGAQHTMLLLNGQGHGFQGEGAQKSIEATVAFFDKHLKPGKK